MMKKFLFVVCLVLMFGACVQKKRFVSYKPAKFAELIQDPSIQLVDVRRPDEYAAGHIERAVLINVQESDFIAKADSLLDKSRPVAVYCRSGKRSRNAAGQLLKEGYKVYNLDVGYIGWSEYLRLKEK